MLPMAKRAQCNKAVERALTIVRRVRSGGYPYHGQACAQRVCFPWSGARAVPQRSCRAGVLIMVRRARSAKTKQSSGCASVARQARSSFAKESGVLTMVRRACDVIAEQSSGCPYHGHAIACSARAKQSSGRFAGL